MIRKDLEKMNFLRGKKIFRNLKNSQKHIIKNLGFFSNKDFCRIFVYGPKYLRGF